MYEIGDVVRIKIVDPDKCSGILGNRNGWLATIESLGSWFVDGDNLCVRIVFQDGRPALTHAINLVRRPCIMEEYHV